MMETHHTKGRRLVIAGSRDMSKDVAKQFISTYLTVFGFPDVVIHGACGASHENPDPPYDGVDGAADELCLDLGIEVERYPADWKKGAEMQRKFTNSANPAGPMRNAEMIRVGDMLLVIRYADSRGSSSIRDLAVARMKPVVDIVLPRGVGMLM